MSHANARLTERGRLLVCERVLAGYRVADVASQVGCSRTTVYKWLARYRSEGRAGLADRSSRPRRCPHATSPEREAAVLWLRRRARRGAEWIAAELGMVASTVGRIIARAGLPRLWGLDRLSGEPIRRQKSTRRYERQRPGELIHVDVKKLGRIPAGGGWRAFGRGARPARHRGLGHEFVHSAIDDHSRLAYSEIHPDERGVSCAGFMRRAAAFFATHGICRIEAVMSDNAFAYRISRDFQAVLAELGARHLLIRPLCPWQNGKVERFNRTLLQEWAYARVYFSNDQRAAALPDWLRFYNERRRHSALGNRPPISRLSATS